MAIKVGMKVILREEGYEGVRGTVVQNGYDGEPDLFVVSTAPMKVELSWRMSLTFYKKMNRSGAAMIQAIH